MRSRLIVVLMVVLSLSFALSFPIFNKDRILEIKYSQLTAEAQHQVTCLADNIYHEAGYEPHEGKVAVGLVTLNRLQDPRFPKDICSVVKQKVKSTCQFTWFCEHKITNRAKEAYEDSLRVALHVYANYERIVDLTDGALYYHADYVNPRWKLERTTVIGRHIFYKEKL